MKADLTGQIHELMEGGMRPVTMTDIKSRAPVRMTVLQRAAARSRLARSRLILAPGGPAAAHPGRGSHLGRPPPPPSPALRAAPSATAAPTLLPTVLNLTTL